MSFRMIPSIANVHSRRGLRGVCAFSIGFSYSVTYLLVSLCLATGMFHAPDAPVAASHQHGDAHAHDHHHDTSSETTWLDICDIALYALLTSIWLPTPETATVGVAGEAVHIFDDGVYGPQVSADLSIRSPPTSNSSSRAERMPHHEAFVVISGSRPAS